MEYLNAGARRRKLGGVDIAHSTGGIAHHIKSSGKRFQNIRLIFEAAAIDQLRPVQIGIVKS